MTVYEFDDYRKYLQLRIDSHPSGGRGQLMKIAKAADIHSSVLSQVFKGSRNLTSEQAMAVCDYLELSETESYFFILLVQLERAGTPRLRRLIAKEVAVLRKNETQVVRRIQPGTQLTEEQKAVYYSHWLYSGIRVLSSVPQNQNAEVLRKRLGLTREMFNEIVQFMTTHGLCRESGGKLEPLMQNTHIESVSPLVSRHHGNWRIKAMEKHPTLSLETELAFTSPLSLSVPDTRKVRAMLLGLIEDVCKMIDPSPPETTYCLNIDWFEF